MFKVTKTTDQGHIPGSLNEYICTSVEDIAHLPRFAVKGTGEGSDLDNAPCGYGSTALVSDGTNTEVYILAPNNQWNKI